MPTVSLKRDHQIIEKVIKAMKTTVILLKKDTKIPKEILEKTLEFSTDFTDLCHHHKEEDAFFPELENVGFAEINPVTRMLEEHEITRQITKKIASSTKIYFDTGNSEQLISDIEEYVEHVSEHLWKENNRVFRMADAKLQYRYKDIKEKMTRVESDSLKSLGKDRQYYEKMSDDIVRGNGLDPDKI